jgi:Fe2+ or Zn2+ uptake regulation protein
MSRDVAAVLREHGIQPSAQRLAVAEYVLATCDHPSAEEVLQEAQRNLPMISRATVYNTLNLFVQKRLLREHVLAAGRTVFDCNMAPHHHFVDEATGDIHDVPWEALSVDRIGRLTGYDIREYMVVLRGTKRPARPPQKRRRR